MKEYGKEGAAKAALFFMLLVGVQMVYVVLNAR